MFVKDRAVFDECLAYRNIIVKSKMGFNISRETDDWGQQLDSFVVWMPDSTTRYQIEVNGNLIIGCNCPPCMSKNLCCKHIISLLSEQYMVMFEVSSYLLFE